MAKGIRWRNGAWQLEYMRHGDRHYTSRDFPKTEAGLKKAIAEREKWVAGIRGGSEQDTNTPFKVVAQQFLDQSDLKLSTYKSYIQLLNQYWMPAFANRPIYTIKPSQIRTVLAQHDVSQKTKKNALIPLRQVFRLALEEEIVLSNPVDAVRIKKHQRPKIQRFTPSEKQRILSRLSGDSLLFFTLAFETGMRTGELLALNWEDITADTILVERAMVRREITETKTHKVRTVFVSKQLGQFLMNQPGRFAGGPLFKDTNGNQRRETKKYLAEWTETLKECRMTYRRPYTCRHTRASEMLMAGVEPAFAAKQLGHTTEMFLNIYAEWISGVKDKDQIRLLDQI